MPSLVVSGRCALLVIALASVAGPLRGAAERPHESCPPTIRDLDLEELLSRRHVPDPSECTFAPGTSRPVELHSVTYAELDDRPGEEAVVRAQTCFMNTGGADISAVYALRCDGSSWSLVEIAIEESRPPADPGRQRSTPRLTVEAGSLVANVELYSPSSAVPEWRRRTVYRHDGGRFVIDSSALTRFSEPGS